MTFIRHNISIILLAIMLMLLTACPSTDKTRAIARAEDDVAQGLSSTANLLKDAEAAGSLAKEDVAFLKPILTEVGKGNLQAIELVKSFKDISNPSLDEQTKLLQIISTISTNLTSLNNEGALRIKDNKKKVLFNTIVVSMQSSATSIVVILNLKGGK